MPSSKPAKRQTTPRPPQFNFNHAMIYSRDVARSLGFYSDLLGFRLVDDFRHDGRLVYVRLRAPHGEGTLALHQLEPGKQLSPDEGVRLYFEVRDLKAVCEQLQHAGMKFTQLPRKMPWGWEHAYLDDPDGHEISLYWAGAKRFRRTVMG